MGNVTVNNIRAMATAAACLPSGCIRISHTDLMEIARIMEGLADKNVSLVAQSRSADLVPWPNEKAASAMYDVFYQSKRDFICGNVQLGRSDSAELAKWLTKVLKLREEK